MDAFAAGSFLLGGYIVQRIGDYVIRVFSEENHVNHAIETPNETLQPDSSSRAEVAVAEDPAEMKTPDFQYSLVRTSKSAPELNASNTEARNLVPSESLGEARQAIQKLAVGEFAPQPMPCEAELLGNSPTGDTSAPELPLATLEGQGAEKTLSKDLAESVPNDKEPVVQKPPIVLHVDFSDHETAESKKISNRVKPGPKAKAKSVAAPKRKAPAKQTRKASSTKSSSRRRRRRT